MPSSSSQLGLQHPKAPTLQMYRNPFHLAGIFTPYSGHAMIMMEPSPCKDMLFTPPGPETLLRCVGFCPCTMASKFMVLGLWHSSLGHHHSSMEVQALTDSPGPHSPRCPCHTHRWPFGWSYLTELKWLGAGRGKVRGRRRNRTRKRRKRRKNYMLVLNLCYYF